MRRASLHLAAVLVLTAGSAAASSSTCVGVLDDQFIIIFDESRLILEDGKAADRSWETETKEAKIEEAWSKFIRDSAAASKGRGSAQFVRDRRDGPHPLAFSRTGNDKQRQKIVLAERSSEQVSHRSLHHFCGQSTITDLYRKIYRYRRDGTPARNITMMCTDYACTTDSGQDCSSFVGFVDC